MLRPAEQTIPVDHRRARGKGQSIALDELNRRQGLIIGSTELHGLSKHRRQLAPIFLII